MYKKKTDTHEEEEYTDEDVYQKDNPLKTDFYRISENKMIAGVCTGLAHYFDIDVTLIRLLWVFAALASGGLAIIAYIIAIIVFPDASPQIKNGGE
ncbi:MAG: PspC domain-containing protein [Calditrichaeota bacterium]|nr:MAG: PspC domain-containing protein [Calditrichota bacterium]MBL1204150.1 PspC domain-containing protein [Calditrichota bacterium]NOG43981.1 PspC domain-containing protein [Calditrichota bacterium]